MYTYAAMIASINLFSFQSAHHLVHKKTFFFTTIMLHAELMLTKYMYENMECIVCCHHLTVIITFRTKKREKKEGTNKNGENGEFSRDGSFLKIG